MPTESEAREQLTDEGMMSYVADGGYVAYEWADEDLVVAYLSADTPELTRALWSIVGSGSSVVKNVLAYVAPDDPIHFLLPEEVAHETYLKRWMLRLLDVQKAVCLRLGPGGFAALYAGTPVHRLRSAGLASGGDSAGGELLDAAFAGSTAYLLEYFWLFLRSDTPFRDEGGRLAA